MKITNLTTQKRDENRVNVFIDGSFALSLNLQEVLDEKIKVGMELTEADVSRLQKVSSDGKLKARMVEWLALRPRSERELKDYLRKKSVDDTLQEQLISTAKKYNWQNDALFAKWWVEQRLRKQRSKQFIRNELRTKGVASEIIDNALLETGLQDSNQLKLLIDKKRKQLRYTDDQKLKEYLLRQGYNYSDIKEALAE